MSPTPCRGVAAFIANLPVEAKLLRQPARSVPLMIWSGTGDRLMKYNGGEIPGGRGWVRSVPETVAWWVQANRADASKAQTVALPDVDPNDGCRIHGTRYPALADGAPVLFYLAEGGGHTMPTQSETFSGGALSTRCWSGEPAGMWTGRRLRGSLWRVIEQRPKLPSRSTGFDAGPGGDTLAGVVEFPIGISCPFLLEFSCGCAPVRRAGRL